MTNFQEEFRAASERINSEINETNPETTEIIENSISDSTQIESNIEDNEYPNFHGEVSENSEHASISGVENISEADTTIRFSSAIWYKKINEQNVVIAGIGGIGSYCLYLMSRLNPSSIYIYDPDKIDVSNMGGQLYMSSDIGDLKVEAAARMATRFSSYYRVFTRPIRFENMFGNVLLCGFDNMEARKNAFTIWKHTMLESNNKSSYLYIDGRLNAEEFQVFCIQGHNQYLINRYEREWLFDDSEAEETVCSYKQTSFTANMIASVMVNLFVNFCANLCNPAIERDVPFLTRYDARTMSFKTE